MGSSGPWNRGKFNFLPAFGGNGGFTLRRRSAMLQVLDLWDHKGCPEKRLAKKCKNEDVILVKELMNHFGWNGTNQTFPDRESAIRFAVETTDYAEPCGFHKSWKYVSTKRVRSILATADMSC